MALTVLGWLALAGCAGEGPSSTGRGSDPPLGPGPGDGPPGATVDFARDVQPIFDRNCSCHLSLVAPEGLVLLGGASFDALVGEPSTQDPSLLRVEPGSPDASYLVIKVDDSVPDVTLLRAGDRMPPALPPLSSEEIETIRRWIEEGAQREVEEPDGGDPSGDEDTTAPEFAGVVAATAASPTQVDVSWSAARDDRTQPEDILYEVFAAPESLEQDFSDPAVAVTGQTSAQVGGLEPATVYFFVVRARDAAGNRDTNIVEVSESTEALPPPTATPRRGDIDGNGDLDITDAVALLRFLFLGEPGPDCLRVADSDADDEITVGDVLSLLRYLFDSGSALPPLGEDEIESCDALGEEMVARGETIFREPAADGNAFSCSTCHAAVADAESGVRHVAHSLQDALRRPSYLLGQVDTFLEVANLCRVQWMEATPWEAADRDFRDVTAFLESISPDEPTPALVYEIVEPLQDPPHVGDPDRGCELFHRSCVVCHGEGAEGAVRGPSLVAFPLPASFIRTKVRLSGPSGTLYGDLQGGLMPFWSAERLSDAELEDLVAFLGARPVPTCDEDGGTP